MSKRPSKKDQQRARNEWQAVLSRFRVSARYHIVGGGPYDGWSVWDYVTGQPAAGPYDTEKRAKLALNRLKRIAP